MSSEEFKLPQDQDMPEQEKPRCPMFSGKWTGGWTCNRLGRGVTQEDLSFCEDAFNDCPAFKGERVLDDRTCKSVEESFKKVCQECRQTMEEMKRTLGDISRSTGLEALCQVSVAADRAQTQCSGLFGGQYTGAAQLSFEKDNAAKLESSLNEALSDICPATGYAGSPSAQPVAGVEEFDRALNTVDSCGSRASDMWYHVSTGLEGDSRFGSAVSSVTGSISQSIDWVISDLRSQVMSAEEQFRSALRAAEAGANGFGGSILSDSGVEWNFSDY